MGREGGSRCTKTNGRGWCDLPSAMDLKVSFNQLSDDFVVFKTPIFFSFSLKVWEFRSAGGSSRTALRQRRQCQMVLCRAQEGTGIRVCFCLFVFVLLHFNWLILQKSGIWIYSWGSPPSSSCLYKICFCWPTQPKDFEWFSLPGLMLHVALLVKFELHIKVLRQMPPWEVCLYQDCKYVRKHLCVCIYRKSALW